MQKWYIVMAKPRQEYSATSFLGQAGVEPYYLEADGCFRLKRRGLFRRQVFLQAIFARFDYERDSRRVFYSRWDERKAVASGPVPAEVDQACFMSFKRA